MQLGRQWLQTLDTEGVQHTKGLTVHTRVSGQLGGEGADSADLGLKLTACSSQRGGPQGPICEMAAVPPTTL